MQALAVRLRRTDAPLVICRWPRSAGVVDGGGADARRPAIRPRWTHWAARGPSAAASRARR
jgi:hypothetical protein